MLASSASSSNAMRSCLVRCARGRSESSLPPTSPRSVRERSRSFWKQPLPSRCDDLDKPFFRGPDASSAPRFEALYRMWNQGGNRVLEDVRSRVIDDANDRSRGPLRDP
jgi:hypothetical protein